MILDFDQPIQARDSIDDDFGFGGEAGFETELDYGQHEPKPAQQAQKPPRPPQQQRQAPQQQQLQQRRQQPMPQMQQQ